MSPKPLIAIDRFYIFLILVLFILSILLIFTLRGIFSTIRIATEIDEQLVPPEIGININNLNKAYDAVFNKENVSLDL